VLATDSVKGAPKLLPNLLVGSVIVLALGLVLSLAALWRHIARTLAAENALRQQMAFRTAMENSLLTGLRARDLEGRVTYVNPAFCRMVGLPAEELIGKKPPMPYWAPEAMADYEYRFEGAAGRCRAAVRDRVPAPGRRARAGAGVRGAAGRQPPAPHRLDEFHPRHHRPQARRRPGRQQQEKLETSARLATMGEISSMLAHELNQPLAAISSYTAGALNVLARAGDGAPCRHPARRRHARRALEQARQQARGPARSSAACTNSSRSASRAASTSRFPHVVDGIRALVELQARQSYVALQFECRPACRRCWPTACCWSRCC
jgi:two-component system sensor histidine kinase DctS